MAFQSIRGLGAAAPAPQATYTLKAPISNAVAVATIKSAIKPLAQQTNAVGANIATRLAQWADWVKARGLPARTVSHYAYGEIQLPTNWNLMLAEDGSYLLPPVCQNIGLTPFAMDACAALAVEKGLPEVYKAQVRDAQRLKALAQAMDVYTKFPEQLIGNVWSRLSYVTDRQLFPLGTARPDGYEAVYRASAEAITPGAYVELWKNSLDYYGGGASTKLMYFGVPEDGSNFTFLPDAFQYARLGIANMLYEEPKGEAEQQDWIRRLRQYFAAWIAALPIANSNIAPFQAKSAADFARRAETGLLPPQNDSASIDKYFVPAMMGSMNAWMFVAPEDFLYILKQGSADIGPLNFRDIPQKATAVTFAISPFPLLTVSADGSAPTLLSNPYDIGTMIVACKDLFSVLIQGDMQQAFSVITGNYMAFWSQRFPLWAQGVGPDRLNQYKAEGQAAYAAMASARAASSPAMAVTTTILSVIPVVGPVLAGVANAIAGISGEIFKGWISKPAATPPELMQRVIVEGAAIPGKYEDFRYVPDVQVGPDGKLFVADGAGNPTNIPPVPLTQTEKKSLLVPLVLGGGVLAAVWFFLRRR